MGRIWKVFGICPNRYFISSNDGNQYLLLLHYEKQLLHMYCPPHRFSYERKDKQKYSVEVINEDDWDDIYNVCGNMLSNSWRSWELLAMVYQHDSILSHANRCSPIVLFQNLSWHLSCVPRKTQHNRWTTHILFGCYVWTFNFEKRWNFGHLIRHQHCKTNLYVKYYINLYF